MKTKLMILFLLVSFVMGTAVQVAFASDASQLAVPRLVVNTSFLNVRTGPGPQYAVVVIVVGGTELPVLASNNSNTWYLVSTAVGSGWVDVIYTLPRGDFRAVPVVDTSADAFAQVQTATTIGLPQAFAAPFVTTATTPLGSTTRAILNVLSVNLRSQPADNGAIIKTLYKDDRVDFAMVGYAYDDRGVRWIAIVVPGVGTGWIEEAKVRTRAAVEGTTTTVSAASSAAGVMSLEVPHVVINTSYQNVRFGPGPQFGVVMTVPGGTNLDVIGVLDDTSWYKVRSAAGDGWVASEFVIFRGTFSNVPVIHSIY